MAKEPSCFPGVPGSAESHMAAAGVAYASGSADACAAHAAMAAVVLLQRLTDASRGETATGPAWERNDVVRGRMRYGTPTGVRLLSVHYLIQRRHEDKPGFWHAMVLKADEGTGVQVGTSTVLREGGSDYRVAQFLD